MDVVITVAFHVVDSDSTYYMKVKFLTTQLKNERQIAHWLIDGIQHLHTNI